MSEDDSERQWVKNLGLFSVIVGDLLGYTGAGILIGYFAWKKWHAPVWILVITSGLGLGMAMYRVYQISQKLMK